MDTFAGRGIVPATAHRDGVIQLMPAEHLHQVLESKKGSEEDGKKEEGGRKTEEGKKSKLALR